MVVGFAETCLMRWQDTAKLGPLGAKTRPVLQSGKGLGALISIIKHLTV
jgi:hypothetical protein